MSARRRSQPLPLRELLNQVLLKRGITRTVEHRVVFEAWERVIPDNIRTRTRALSFRGGRLLVGVSSAPLFEELRCFREAEFLRLLNEEITRTGVTPAPLVTRLELRRA